MPDLSITAVTFQKSVNLISIRVGETVNAFDFVYRDETTKKYLRSSAASLAASKADYILLGGGVLDQWVAALRLSSGTSILMTVAGGLTVAEQYVVSATPGKAANRADLTTGQFLTNILLGKAAGEALVNVLPSEIAIP